MGHGIDALFRLSVTFVVDGQNCMNTFWFRSKPTTPSVTLQEDTDSLLTEWDTLMWPLWKGLQGTACQHFAAVAQCMNPPGTAISIASYTTQFGTVAGDMLPSFCQAGISWYTQYPGRRTHGRVMIPGITEADVSQSVLSSSAMTRLANVGSSWVTRYGVAGVSTRWWGVVYSRKNGNGYTTTLPRAVTYSPLAGVPIARFVAHNEVGTQRHRRLHRGV